jgi:non-ribosomal peptide synthetase component F
MHQSICERFADIVQASPRRIALTHGQKSLSYVALRDAALAQAAYLAEFGVGRGARVYIEIPRGPGQLISLLAVLHAGAAYVPHRQETDASREAELLLAWGITHVLTVTPDRQVPAPAIRIDAKLAHEVAMSGRAPASTPLHPPGAESPACILSTSGTTGAPKGIMLPHRSHVGLVVGSTYCDFSADTRMLYYSPL